jgi:two-component system response regulator PilR (NtrC family)
MAANRVLIIDDEPDIRALLEITLNRMGLSSQAASGVTEAKAQLEANGFDLCLTDLKLPDGDGIDIVEHIQALPDPIPVAVFTAHGDMETAVRALKAGAFDFVSKPVDLSMLRRLVTAALKVQPPDAVTPKSDRSERLIGDTPAVQELRETIAKVARSQAPVHICGESGTGKELVARLVHEQGPRSGQPFVAINCGAIPTELMESELFGHRKGSFTGATGDKDGLFVSADGGTLFLDEIAELPMHMQVKLLRAIQEKAVRPVGASSERRVDVRILSATHQDLAALVQQGRFRQDLFYRINVIELRVPSLRERRDDIHLLAAHILSKLAPTNGAGSPVLTADALKALSEYAFPGNVRELENILERALALAEARRIDRADLRLPEDGAGVPPGANGNGSGQLAQELGDIERERILEALEETRWNRTAAARRLGLTLRQLRYRLKKLELE